VELPLSSRLEVTTFYFRGSVMRMPELGKFLVIFGLIIVIIGVLLSLGLGNWMGKLPGDVRIERGNSAFYFPIVTCIVISIVLSVLFSLFRR
jgi:hypothetical protein